MTFCRKNVLLLLVILFFLCVFNSDTKANRTSSKTLRKKSIVELFFQGNTTLNTKNRKHLCRWLKGLKHQNKLCLKRKNLPEILLETKKLIVSTCQSQFQYDQWNCSNIKKFSKKIYRETAFMQALTAAALMYKIAQACGLGKLANCPCASHGKSNATNWEWGGCGDNTKDSKSLTKKFLQMKKKSDDPSSAIFKYNCLIGMRIVLANEEKQCKCMGISGSCTMKVCSKRLRKFEVIAHDLKNLYHNAIQSESRNNIHIPQEEIKRNQLLYLENSPNFCPSTGGRRCKNVENCATLCCGRGFYSTIHTIRGNSICNCNFCNCKIDKNLKVSCRMCEKNETILSCK